MSDSSPKSRGGAGALLLLLLATGVGSLAAESGGLAEARSIGSVGAGFEPAAVVSAFATAYPDRIERVRLRDGDWALEIDGAWYFWAGGRLLPEELRRESSRWDPYPFYYYPARLLPVERPDAAALAALRERVSRRESDPPRRHPGFFNALWRIDDRDSSWRRVKTTWFMGFKLDIHRYLLEDLAAVEEELQARLPEDAELRRYFDGLLKADAYNWREIAGTSSLSFHSYGAAVDLLPRSYGGRQAYWRWAAENYDDWFLLPHSERFLPPESLIEAFERHGFIWGGKWFYFDTMHFEYRPEILVLNGLR